MKIAVTILGLLVLIALQVIIAIYVLDRSFSFLFSISCSFFYMLYLKLMTKFYLKDIIK